MLKNIEISFIVLKNFITKFPINLRWKYYFPYELFHTLSHPLCQSSFLNNDGSVLAFMDSTSIDVNSNLQWAKVYDEGNHRDEIITEW